MDPHPLLMSSLLCLFCSRIKSTQREERSDFYSSTLSLYPVGFYYTHKVLFAWRDLASTRKASVTSLLALN